MKEVVEQRSSSQGVRQEYLKPSLAVEKIEPNKWYGICYGRDLDKECGKHYQ